jgi:hypothetical protein
MRQSSSVVNVRQSKGSAEVIAWERFSQQIGVDRT